MGSAYVCLYSSIRRRVSLLTKTNTPWCVCSSSQMPVAPQEWGAHHELPELWLTVRMQKRQRPAIDSQWKEIIIKRRLFCWHICSGLHWLPAGSYDHDDILKETLWGKLPAPSFLRSLGQEISSLGFHRGKFRQGWWRPWPSWMRMDEDIWLSVLRIPIWLCHKPMGELKKKKKTTPEAWSHKASAAFLLCISHHQYLSQDGISVTSHMHVGWFLIQGCL